MELYGKERVRNEIETARFALNYLKKKGAQARITLAKGVINTFSVLNGKADKLQRSNDRALNIQIYYKQRYGSFSTNRLERGELERFLENGLYATSLVESDPARALPPEQLYYSGENPDLGQFDPSADFIPAEKKREIAFEICSQMEGKSKYLVSAESEYNDYMDYQYIIDSQGFEGDTLQSDFDVSAHCSVKESGDARFESYWFESSLNFNNLEYKKCGRRALERGLEKFNPHKIGSGRFNMVVENRYASRLVSPIFNALSGASIQQKNSFLSESLGKRIFGKNVTFIDRPHRYGMAGSRYFDFDGVATKEITFIEEGVINNFFIDSYYARKLNMEITAEGPSVPELLCGADGGGEFAGTKEMIARLDEGILVTGFNGGNCNAVTGDFSYGIEGFYFKSGEIIHPVREMNITGNIVSLWNNLAAAGSDPLKWAKWQIPSLAFYNVNFNGK